MPYFLHDGVRIAYELDGPAEAQVVLLSSSLGTSGRMWAPQVPALAARFRVLRYDMRGHGSSAAPPGAYTVAQLGGDVLALLDHLGVERVHFCGLSLGGMIGQWLGVHAGARVQRLVLCNTAARIGTPQAYDARITAVRARGLQPLADAVLARWFTPAFLASNSPAVAAAREMLVTTPAEGYAAACAAVRDFDFREDAQRIAAPTLVIAGVHDLATPLADAHELAARIPGAVETELDAAHISNLERPHAFTRALADFLTA